MHPKKFVEKWGITRSELGQITGKSLETVNRWFSDREAGADIKTLLAGVNAAWTTREALDAMPSHIWGYYDLVKARRAAKAQEDKEIGD
jgi:hypothetical protein